MMPGARLHRVGLPILLLGLASAAWSAAAAAATSAAPAAAASATATAQDRGPYVPGRIIDLSPATADKIGLTKKAGVAEVEVTPIRVPLPDGGSTPGAAANGR